MTGVRVVIVGGGPAGVRAAETLVANGCAPVLIDEADRVGGQIYRQRPHALEGRPGDLYGFEARKAVALHETFARLESMLDYRPGTLAWNVQDGTLHLCRSGRLSSVTFDALILATGATDRMIPLRGWTLPGVYTLGGAQIALKYQACTIGRRTAFVGSTPLLYLTAYQYARAGAEIAALVDTGTWGAKASA
ncbi:MAG: FAD-dependent oxidoreductase, partial [Burkholderiales bacterium]